MEQPTEQPTENVLPKRTWGKNVVHDETAPLFYSQRAIYFFSLFFSALFGAILLAINVKRTGNPKGAWIVAGFGVAYSILCIIIFSHLQNSAGASLLAGLLGALLLNNHFWKKYIGNTQYRAESIWTPLVIGILILIILFLLTFLPR